MKLGMLIVTLALGCGGKKDASPSADPPAVTSPPTSGDGVELLSSGDPSTARSLRYQLAKGTQSFVDLQLAVEAGRPMPRLAQKLEIDVEDVAPDGTAQVRTTIVDAKILVDDEHAGAAPMFDEMARSITGLGFTAKLRPNGRLVESRVVNADKLPPKVRDQVGQLTQGIEQVAMPLPEQPVGVGAKWSTRKPIKQAGIDMVTVTTTEITGIDEHSIRFESRSTVTGPDQSTKIEDVQVAVKDIGGGGVASGTVDLARMTMAGKFELEFRGTMTAVGQTTPMKTRLTLTMSPAADAGSGSAAP